MPDNFHDTLASLCARELSAALAAKDADRASDVVTALGTMLGRTIARATNGSAEGIDTMLIAAEQLVASEAAGMAGVIALAHAMKQPKVEKHD